jgi:hypothetical protein
MVRLEDVEAWIDDMCLDDDGTSLWRDCGALILDDVMNFTLDVAYVEDDVTLEDDRHMLELI